MRRHNLIIPALAALMIAFGLNVPAHAQPCSTPDVVEVLGCVTGPDIDPGACICLDRDGDLDSDLRDFAEWQTLFPNPPGTPIVLRDSIGCSPDGESCDFLGAGGYLYFSDIQAHPEFDQAVAHIEVPSDCTLTALSVLVSDGANDGSFLDRTSYEIRVWNSRAAAESDPNCLATDGTCGVFELEGITKEHLIGSVLYAFSIRDVFLLKFDLTQSQHIRGGLDLELDSMTQVWISFLGEIPPGGSGMAIIETTVANSPSDIYGADNLSPSNWVETASWQGIAPPFRQHQGRLGVRVEGVTR